MARLKVNPTRMEMKNLQHRLNIAKRGHRLLKEKQDSMIRVFMTLSEEARVLRRQVEDQFVRVYGAYRKASILGDDALIQKSLTSTERTVNLDVYRDYVSGIRVPGFRLERQDNGAETQSLLAVYRDIDAIQDEYNTLLPRLVELAEIEKRCLIIAGEIKETRRRVNSLEYRTIPNIQETLVFISMKIADNERSQLARVMKVNKK